MSLSEILKAIENQHNSRSNIDWLGLETVIRSIFSLDNHQINQKYKLDLIDEALSAFTGR